MEKYTDLVIRLDGIIDYDLACEIADYVCKKYTQIDPDDDITIITPVDGNKQERRK